MYREGEVVERSMDRGISNFSKSRDKKTSWHCSDVKQGCNIWKGV